MSEGSHNVQIALGFLPAAQVADDQPLVDEGLALVAQQLSGGAELPVQ